MDVRGIGEGIDPGGRTAAHDSTLDGKVLDRVLVRIGLVWWHHALAPDIEDLETLQADAMATRVGPWRAFSRCRPG